MSIWGRGVWTMSKSWGNNFRKCWYFTVSKCHECLKVLVAVGGGGVQPCFGQCPKLKFLFVPYGYPKANIHLYHQPKVGQLKYKEQGRQEGKHEWRQRDLTPDINHTVSVRQFHSVNFSKLAFISRFRRWFWICIEEKLKLDIFMKSWNRV